MAADAQTQAAREASQTQLAMFNKSQANLDPFRQLGTGAISPLESLTGTGAGGNPLTARLTAPFNPTIADLEATPGYKFTLDQGLKSVQNGYASRGLADSGAALKGAADYTTGLASNTYQQQFANHLSQNQQIYNMLLGQTSLGANAAAGQATNAQNTGQAVANNIIGAGNAQAASYIAGANAVGGAGSNIANGLMQYNMMSKFLGAGGGATAGFGAGMPG